MPQDNLYENNDGSGTSISMRYGGATTEYPDGVRNTQDARLTYTVPADQVKGLVVFVHGGGWVEGDEDDHEGMLSELQAQGYATLSVGYRLAYNRGTDISEGGEFPNNGLDVLKAMEIALGISNPEEGLLTDDENAGWQQVQDFANRSFMVSGISAGSHLVTWATTKLLTENPQVAERIDGVLMISGPLDVRSPEIYTAGHWDNVLIPTVGGREAALQEPVGGTRGHVDQDILNEISPVHHVLNNPDAPWAQIPWFSVIAPNDGLVPYEGVKPMLDALRGSGAVVEDYIVDGDINDGGHMFSQGQGGFVGRVMALFPEHTIAAQEIITNRERVRIENPPRAHAFSAYPEGTSAAAAYGLEGGIDASGVTPSLAFSSAAAGDATVPSVSAEPGETIAPPRRGPVSRAEM